MNLTDCSDDSGSNQFWKINNDYKQIQCFQCCFSQSDLEDQINETTFRYPTTTRVQLPVSFSHHITAPVEGGGISERTGLETLQGKAEAQFKMNK